MDLEPSLHGEESPEESTPEFHWYHKASALLVIIFCLEVGLFLIAFPWSEYWETNFFFSFAPGWYQFWQNAYARGAVSGLGALNIYISFQEVFRLRRFARGR